MACKPIRVRDLARPMLRYVAIAWLGQASVAFSHQVRPVEIVATGMPAQAIRATPTPVPTPVPRQGPTQGRPPAEKRLETLVEALERDAPPSDELEVLAADSPLLLRAALEIAFRPLGRAAEQWIEQLERRPDVAGKSLAIEWTARLAPDVANRRLVHILLDSDPLAAARAPRALTALSEIAAIESLDAILAHVRSENPEARTAARAAGNALVSQLLAEARIDEALTVSDGLCAADPRHAEFELSRAMTRGVYASLPDAARAALTEVTRDAPREGSLAAARSERELALAAISFFGGDESRAETELERARFRLGPIPQRPSAVALTAGRIDFAWAVTALAGATPDPAAARAAIRRAIEHRPHDDGVYLGDGSLFGPCGARAWLERLRRTDRPEVRHEFYRILLEELEAAEPPVAADDEIPARSWVPVWTIYARIDDGDLEEGLAIAKRTAARLERATAWSDRWMLAEIELARAIALHLSGDSRRALDELPTVLRRIDELAGAEVDQLAFDAREIVPTPGSPPLRDSLRDARMRAERVSAEASWALGQVADARKHAKAALAADPFDDACVALELAAAVASGDDRDRGERAFATLPRAAGTLLDLSRLAFALGRAEAGEELFERHVSWNALTPAREAVERARRGRDPSLRQ